MRVYQRIIRTLLSWRYLAMVVAPLHVMAVVPMLLARLNLHTMLLVLACVNLFILVTPCLIDRTDLIEGPFNSGNPEKQLTVFLA